MTRFIQQCACRGIRPASVVPERFASRPHLVSQLLRNRRVARFLVAPTGFGKATVAYEYAEVVFGFQHVFWISGTSPCFLRDLDAGVLASAVVACDPEASLAVLADVPVLDEEREAAFSMAIDRLMESGCEVIVTCAPAADGWAALQRDRVAVGARDLLVDEEEARVDDLAPFRPAVGLPLAMRVPCLRWGEEGQAALVRGLAAEELPAETRIALWAVLAMGCGSRSDLALLVGSVRAGEIWGFLAQHYPYAGIEADEDTFDAVAVPLPILRAALAPSLDALARIQGRFERDEMVRLVADRMVARGAGRRAAMVMGAFASREAVSAWLGQAGWHLLWADGGAELEELYRTVCRIRVEERAGVNAMMAWARALAGDGRRAIEFARKALGSPQASDTLRAAAALAAYGQGNAAARRAMAEPVESWLARIAQESTLNAHEGALRALASVALADRSGEDPLARWHGVARELLGAAPVEGDLEQALLLAAAWALDAAASTGAFEPGREDASLLAGADLAALASFVAECAERAAAGGSLGLGGREAAAALERIEGALALAGLPGLGERAQAALDEARISMARGGREAAASSRSRRSSAPAGPGADPFAAPCAPAAFPAVSRGDALDVSSRAAAVPLAPPLLHVRLFGAMTVSVGETDVTAALKSRRRARLLLALLVLHRGRELTRERIVAMMWPAADQRTGAKSFYRVWSELSRILAVGGRCPYLVRDRYGCRLDPALLVSDVVDFESLTRRLLFGPATGSLAWEQVILQLQETFDAPLLPAEGGCETVGQFRERFATEMVDGLVAASCRLRRDGEPQGALWFAREALRRDGTREDVYAALMRAQMVSDQRSAALDTFFACRDFLGDSLGLDPSPSLQALYQSLLEGDTAVGERDAISRC